MTDAECRAYLLGQMPPSDAERLEARLLEDTDLFQAMLSAEDDLFDGLARGQLTPGERARFLERFGSEPQRIAFARALALRTGSAAARRPPVWIPLAAAAAVVLAIGGGWWLRSHPAPAAPATATTLSAPTHAAAPVVALLTLGTSRAAGNPAAIAIPAGTETIDLRVRLNPADRFEQYAMELRSASDTVVWRGDGLHAAPQAGDLVVGAPVAAARLADGVYELSVRAGGTDLGYLSVRIMRTP